MQSINTSDVVADIESARANRAFNNWIAVNKEQVITLYRVMRGEPATPLSVRAAIQMGYLAGFKDAEAERKPVSYGGEHLGTEL